MARKQLWLIAGVTGSLMLGLGLIAPLLPLIRDDMNLSGRQLGLLVAAFPAARLAFAFVAGLAVDHFGLRRLGILACLFSGASAASAGLSTSPGALVALQFGMGAGSVFYSAAAAAHVLETAPPNHAGRAMSSFQTFTLVGGALGPVLGALAGASLGIRAPFLIYAALSVVGAALTWAYVEDPAPARRAGRTHHGSPAPSSTGGPEPRRAAGRRVHHLLWLAAITFFAARAGHVNTLLPIVAFDELGLSVDAIGFALAGTVLATVLAVPQAGRLADRGLSRPLLVGFTLAMAGCVALLGHVRSVGAFYVLLAFFGVCAAALVVVPQVLLVAWSAPGRRGRAVGSHRTAAAFGMVLGPMAAGWAVEVDQVLLAFTAGAGLLAVVAVSLLGLPRGRGPVAGEPAPNP